MVHLGFLFRYSRHYHHYCCRYMRKNHNHVQNLNFPVVSRIGLCYHWWPHGDHHVYDYYYCYCDLNSSGYYWNCDFVEWMSFPNPMNVNPTANHQRADQDQDQDLTYIAYIQTFNYVKVYIWFVECTYRTIGNSYFVHFIRFRNKKKWRRHIISVMTTTLIVFLLKLQTFKKYILFYSWANIYHDFSR